MNLQKNNSFHFIVVFSFILLFSKTLYAKIEWVPVVRLQGLGGQFFFEGEQTSFSGNADWVLAPGIKFSDRWSLIPTVSGKYQRVREVQELIGGGFLTRETFENTALLKGIYQLNESWKIKLKGSYKNQLLVESADEKLGKGLFDNNKLSVGTELERTGSIFRSIRLSFDPYGVRFPRYQTLVSGSSFGSEVNSGVNTLDFNAYDITYSMECLLSSKILLALSALGSYRPYTDQTLVTTSGEYENNKRLDFFAQLNTNIAYKLPDIPWLPIQNVLGLDTSYAFLDSNQHNYDASRTQFNTQYYDYSEFHLAPKWIGRLFEKLDFVIAYDYGKRIYTERLIQNSDGAYQTSKIYLNIHSITYTFKYPWKYGLSLLASGTYRRSLSNMAYERTYRYNYYAQHYFIGFSWEY